MVQFADPPRNAEIVFHHPLDWLVAFTAVVQALRHAELTIKQQAVIVATDLQMQGEANAPEDVQTFIQFGAFCQRQEAKADHFIQRGSAKMAAGDPLQSMNIAQAAGAAFDIRLQVVARAVIALVALILLFHFGGVKFIGRPETFAKNMLL